MVFYCRCAECNKEIVKADYQIKSRLKIAKLLFCSRDCARKGRHLSLAVSRLNGTDEFNMLWSVSCAKCNKDIEMTIADGRIRLLQGCHFLYCSKTCSRTSNRPIVLRSPKTTKKIISQCLECNKQIIDYVPRKYCSTKCSAIRYKGKSEMAKHLQTESARIKSMTTLAKKGKLTGTNLELIIRNLLTENGIPYQTNTSVTVITKSNKSKTYFPDMVIDNLKIDIECDGKYWHSKNKTKIKDIERDEALNINGWSVIRLSEDLILNNTEECLRIIKEKINLLKSS